MGVKEEVNIEEDKVLTSWYLCLLHFENIKYQNKFNIYFSFDKSIFENIKFSCVSKDYCPNNKCLHGRKRRLVIITWSSKWGLWSLVQDCLWPLMNYLKKRTNFYFAHFILMPPSKTNLTNVLVSKQILEVGNSQSCQKLFS